MFAARVAVPLNPESLGMPSGRMTSPCVMTVPKGSLRVSDTLLTLSEGVIVVTQQGNVISTG